MTEVAELTVPAVATNVPDVAPCPIVSVEGTLAPADEPNAIVAPPLNAAEVRLTVQVDPPDGVMERGLHERLFNLGAWRMVTVPPDNDAVSGAPVGLAIIPFCSCTEEDVLVVEADNSKVMEASVPLGTVESLMPHIRHVAAPGVFVHESDLLAAAGPAATLAEEKSAVE